jgi:hypothetical protein
VKAKLVIRLAFCSCLSVNVGQKVVAQGYNYEAKERAISVGYEYGYMFSDASSIAQANGLIKTIINQDKGIGLCGEYRRYIKDGLAYAFSVGLEKYSGGDDNPNNSRGYKYKSVIGEFSALGNFEFLSFFFHKKIPFDIYAIAGGGYMRYSINGVFAQSSPRPTAGDKLSKSGGSLEYIGGMGVRITSGWRRIDFRIEGKFHHGTSDYLDGYSPKFSMHNDVIMNLTFKLCFKLHDGGDDF